ncbi:hypothetical protein [Streptomyces anulatus]|uniref:hypothetical protein n=1 Tax=Streptomyces anulatus TaxID=1892 RepID=UPI0036CEE0BE
MERHRSHGRQHLGGDKTALSPPRYAGQKLDAGLSVDEFPHDIEVTVVAGNLFDEDQRAASGAVHRKAPESPRMGSPLLERS